jgi:hypothetical protein
MSTEKGEEVKAKGLHNIFNKNSRNFPKLRENYAHKIREASRTPNRPDQNRTTI